MKKYKNLKRRWSKPILKSEDDMLKPPKTTFFESLANLANGIVLTAASTIVALCVMPSHALPDAKMVKNKLASFGINPSTACVVSQGLMPNNGVSRLCLPKHKEVYKVYVGFETTEEQRQIFQEVFDEFNAFFKEVNPAYKFELDYNPSFLDKISPYAVTYVLKDGFNNPSLCGRLKSLTLPTYEGSSVCFGTIELKQDNFKDRDWAKQVIMHEFMHQLGVADFYHPKTPKERESVMCPSSGATHLQQLDKEILTALYSCKDSQAEMEK